MEGESFLSSPQWGNIKPTAQLRRLVAKRDVNAVKIADLRHRIRVLDQEEDQKQEGDMDVDTGQGKMEDAT